MSEKIYTIEEIKAILTTVLDNMPVYSVVLFGSYAKNCATKNSDLDFIIDTNICMERNRCHAHSPYCRRP